MKKIVVIDGNGGKIGKAIIDRLMEEKLNAEVIAIGTNAIATAYMIKNQPIQGATGENPVVVNSSDADIIMGPLGILAANSLLGEITERMAVAVSSSKATKILIPMNRCHILVAQTKEDTLKNYIEAAVVLAKDNL